MRLTPSQQRAIAHEGRNLQLIACAGSGKTEVVARRVVHLLRLGSKDALAPRNIVAFTFTEKAAAELKERIITRAREELGEVTGLAEMFVGTIHAFCLEVLKTEVAKYLKYEVLNEVQQGLFVDRHSSQSGLTTSTDLKGALLKRYRDTQHYIEALSILRFGQQAGSVFVRFWPAVRKATAPVTDQVGTKSGLSRDQVAILTKCLEECALRDIMALAGRSNRTKFRDQVLKPLLKTGLLEMTIPDKPRSRLQKYRLTDMGRAWLAAQRKMAAMGLQ